MTETARPLIGITMGDPSGIGPEVAVKALARASLQAPARPLVIGHEQVMCQAVHRAGLALQVRSVQSETDADFQEGVVNVLQPEGCHVGTPALGQVSAEAGHAAFVAIEKAIALAQERRIHAVVTGPIHKEAINAAGHHFPGHTEIFAQYTGTEDFAMLLAYGDLKVIHVTTHIPLCQVSESITRDRILKVIGLAHDACKKLGIEQPRIGVAGLNPHAGDGGLFGQEEAEHIIPAVKAAQDQGMDVQGPIPPDTLFPKALGGWYDICVVMYHDQGHIPLKVVGFTWDRENDRWDSVNGVNITLGLPIIRTSVDHGTAFDIAGKNIASPESTVQAIEYAVQLAQDNVT